MLLLPHACLCIRIWLACSPVLSLSVAALPAVAVRPCLCLLRSLSCIGWTLNIPVLHRIASHAVLHRVDIKYPPVAWHLLCWPDLVEGDLYNSCGPCQVLASRSLRSFLSSVAGFSPAPEVQVGFAACASMAFGGGVRTALAEEGGVIRGMPAALRADASIHLRPAFHAGGQWMGISPHVVASASCLRACSASLNWVILRPLCIYIHIYINTIIHN